MCIGEVLGPNPRTPVKAWTTAANARLKPVVTSDHVRTVISCCLSTINPSIAACANIHTPIKRSAEWAACHIRVEPALTSTTEGRPHDNASNRINARPVRIQNADSLNPLIRGTKKPSAVELLLALFKLLSSSLA